MRTLPPPCAHFSPTGLVGLYCAPPSTPTPHLDVGCISTPVTVLDIASFSPPPPPLQYPSIHTAFSCPSHHSLLSTLSSLAFFQHNALLISSEQLRHTYIFFCPSLKPISIAMALKRINKVRSVFFIYVIWHIGLPLLSQVSALIHLSKCASQRIPSQLFSRFKKLTDLTTL